MIPTRPSSWTPTSRCKCFPLKAFAAILYDGGLPLHNALVGTQVYSSASVADICGLCDMQWLPVETYCRCNHLFSRMQGRAL